MTAVADASVLIALGRIGQLSLLPRRFPEGILIPEAVWQEVVENGQGRPGTKEIAAASWVRVQAVRDRSLVSLLCAELDLGEAEAIALSREEQVEVALLDEKDGRRVARRLGLKVLGTVGLLTWAKRMGRVTSLREQLDTLQTQGKSRLSQTVYDEALRMVGEADGSG